VAVGHELYPYLYNVLIAVGYGLILPAVAVMHLRHRGVRDSGAILGTIAGTAVVAVGLVASVNVDLRVAALFVLGMWWWTIGKMWVVTGVLPRELGTVTAALGALALGAAFLESANILSAFVPGYPDIDVWTLGHVALGVWLIAIAVVLARPE
jgi:hypothetical protein